MKFVRGGEGFVGRNIPDFGDREQWKDTSTANKVKSGVLQKRKERYAYLDEVALGPSVYLGPSKEFEYNVPNRMPEMKNRVGCFDARFLGVSESFKPGFLSNKGMTVSGPVDDVVDGRSLLRFDASRNSGDWRLRVWIDPVTRQNTRIVGEAKDTSKHIDINYKRDAASGMWYPSEEHVHFYKKGILEREEHTVVTRAELNVPIDPSEFSYQSLNMAPGTIMRDVDNKQFLGTWDGSRLIPMGNSGPTTQPNQAVVDAMTKKQADTPVIAPSTEPAAEPMRLAYAPDKNTPPVVRVSYWKYAGLGAAILAALLFLRIAFRRS